MRSSAPICEAEGGARSGPAAVADPAGLSLDVVEDAGDWSGFADLDRLVADAAQALAANAALRPRLPAEATVVLSSDAEVRKLNKQWRRQDKPTNVLSFPAMPAPAGRGPRLLGDVILAAETIAREAAAQAIPPAHHLQHLIVHGVLHLAGYDHESEAEAVVMERLEVEILAGLGIADPYDGSDPVTEERPDGS